MVHAQLRPDRSSSRTRAQHVLHCFTDHRRIKRFTQHHVDAAGALGLCQRVDLATARGNVTGVSALGSDYVAKSLQLLKETANLKTVRQFTMLYFLA